MVIKPASCLLMGELTAMGKPPSKASNGGLVDMLREQEDAT
jgi:hypothetical protein